MRVSKSEAESAAIWKGRKAAFGAMGRLADYLCMDGIIPTGRLPEVLDAGRRDLRRLRPRGRQHLPRRRRQPASADPLQRQRPGELEKAEHAGADILKLCVEVGGCLTGEHGVGVEKRDLMPFQFTPADLDQQMRVKSVFDPHWLLNPAKVFPLDGRPVPAA